MGTLVSIVNVSSQLLNHISRSSYVAKTTVKTLCEGNAAHSDYGTRGKAHPNRTTKSDSNKWKTGSRYRDNKKVLQCHFFFVGLLLWMPSPYSPKNSTCKPLYTFTNKYTYYHLELHRTAGSHANQCERLGLVAVGIHNAHDRGPDHEQGVQYIHLGDLTLANLPLCAVDLGTLLNHE